MAIDFEKLFKSLVDGVTDLAKGTLREFQKEAVRDGKAFLQKTKSDLKRWVTLLGNGDLTKEDFEFLVLARKDVAEMLALKQTGLAQARLDRFTFGVIELIISTASKAAGV